MNDIHPLAFKFARYAAQAVTSLMAFLWVSSEEADMVQNWGHMGFLILIGTLCISGVYSMILTIIVGYNVFAEPKQKQGGYDGNRLRM